MTDRKATNRPARNKRLSVALTPDMYDRIGATAAKFGMSANAWAAYTLASAVNNQEALLTRLNDETAQVITRLVEEAAKGDPNFPLGDDETT